MGTPTNSVDADEKELREELRDLEAAFELAGGRGVELAERIDELREELGESL